MGVTAALLSAGALMTAGPAAAAPLAADPLAAAGEAGSPQQTITWAPCKEDATAECATLAVPIDWARPDGPTIDLALARRQATDPAARIGSLVINPGGPGGSGVEAVLEGYLGFSKDLQRRFDIVGFDPRGVARSHPIRCSASVWQESPSMYPTSQAEFDALAAYNRRLAADCRERTGPLFDHVDTVSVAHDLDAIRQALGERKLTYYGISYGTLLGQMYAENFGDRARALLLDSNMDHSLGTAQFLYTETAFDEDSFDEFAAWCERTVTCQVRDKGARALLADFKARAARGELVLRVKQDGEVFEIPADFTLVTGLVHSAAYGPHWLELAEYLYAIDTGGIIDLDPPEGEAAAGSRGRAKASIAAAMRASGDHRAGFADEPGDETVENSMSIFCEDYSLPIRDYREYSGHLREMNRLAPDMGPSVMGLSAAMQCLGWPGPVNNPQHPLRVRKGPKLLLTNALHDPATGYAWATNAAKQLGNRAVLVTYEGWGHGVYGRSACVTGAFDSYLIDVAVPAKGTSCPAVEPPSTRPGPPQGAGASSDGASSDGAPSVGSSDRVPPRRGGGW